MFEQLAIVLMTMVDPVYVEIAHVIDALHFFGADQSEYRHDLKLILLALGYLVGNDTKRSRAEYDANNHDSNEAIYAKV